MLGFSSAAVAIPAFPGAQGYGVETVGGRGGQVILVTNTNDSGPGSFREAMLTEAPRIIVFRVSGTIDLQSTIRLGSAHSFVTVAGQTAPGDGIAISGLNLNGALLELSGDGGNAPGVFHDGVFQHLRFRHAFTSRQSADSRIDDNLVIYDGTYNVVFDHNSFTWSGDEVLNFWGSGIHDITMSHNIMAEGITLCVSGNDQNLGPLLAGGNPHTRISWHRNLLAHMCYRNILQSTSTNGQTGSEYINNVNYNMASQHFGFDQNQYWASGQETQADIVNSFFKDGPDVGVLSANVWPVTYSRFTPGTYGSISLHFAGSTWRDINGNPHPLSDEADNYNMMNWNDFGHGEPNVVRRNTRISPSAPYPVTISSAAQAYNEIVIDKNVGATKPVMDLVDQRIVNDPEDGGRWDSANLPPPHGTGSFPTLLTYNMPTDSDGDGVPDDYETNELATDPDVFEPQAVLDHDGDGYANIEEYIHSLNDAVAQTPPTTRPNPPTSLASN